MLHVAIAAASPTAFTPEVKEKRRELGFLVVLEIFSYMKNSGTAAGSTDCNVFYFLSCLDGPSTAPQLMA